MAKIPLTWNGVDAQGNPLRWATPGLVWGGFVPQPNPTRMPHLRVHLGFTTGTDHGVEEIAGSVSQQLYGNASFPLPPVTKVALDGALDLFTKAIAAQSQGGTAATADKHNKRDFLIALLRQLAGYVQSRHGDDLAVLLSSGFDAVSTNRAPSALTAPKIRDILNGNSGQLIVRVQPMKNIRIFKVRYAAIGAGGVPGPQQDGGLHNDSRSMVINGLTPGTMYAVQVQAIAGGRNESDWSDAMSHMSM